MADPTRPDDDSRLTTGTVVQSDGAAGRAAAASDRAAPWTPPGYELLGELGRGGMGVVYKARQTALNRVVAIKLISAEGSVGDLDRRRFRVEAEAVARLQHPNVVQVFDAGEHAGRPYLVMEYLPGGSLAGWVKGELRPPSEVVRVVEQVARGVGYCHAYGVLHRDLKPANVLLAEDGTPKVADFGLAKLVGAEVRVTATGAILGTPAYMAPEQAAGGTSEAAGGVGPAADVYALGCILYALLTGRPPFTGRTPCEVLARVVDEVPVSIRELRPDVPSTVEAVVMRCLSKASADRYPSARALADELAEFGVCAWPVAEPVGRRRRVASQAAGGLHDLLFDDFDARKLGRAVGPHVAGLVVVGLLIIGAVEFADSWRRHDDMALRFFHDAAPPNAAMTDGQMPTEYLDRDGRPFDLGQFHGRKYVVVVFVRAVPESPACCSFCSPQVGSLAAYYVEFASRGAEVAVVFPGPAKNASKFYEAARKSGVVDRLPFPLLLDPDLKAVNKLGIRAHMAKPSTYILDRQGRVVYAYVGANMTDRPSVKAILGQLDRLAGWCPSQPVLDR